jgi:hypothetical protein
VEGKAIRFFKHFKLKQSAVKHHEFDLILAHDTLGSAENHNLEEAQIFWEKELRLFSDIKMLKRSGKDFCGLLQKLVSARKKEAWKYRSYRIQPNDSFRCGSSYSKFWRCPADKFEQYCQ